MPICPECKAVFTHPGEAEIRASERERILKILENCTVTLPIELTEGRLLGPDVVTTHPIKFELSRINFRKFIN